mgnify:CR=1 FL=1
MHNNVDWKKILLTGGLASIAAPVTMLFIVDPYFRTIV